MNGNGFQELISQLGDLSVVQCEALIAAFKQRLPMNKAVAMIVTRFSADQCCGHCCSRHVAVWSSQDT